MALSKPSLGLILCAAIASAGPVDFGLAEYNAALASRGLKWKVTAELSLDPPETFRIEPYRLGGAHISGGDLRGLMYGLIEASEQIRATGKFAQVHGAPYAPVRGVRLFVHDWDLAKYPEDFWRAYFQTLARDRFNRFKLVFLERTPYPLLIAVDGYPGVRVPGFSNEQRDRNLHMLRLISQTAAEYAIDFTLGIWDNPSTASPLPIEGLNRANVGPYSHDALRKLLAACPMIRELQIQTNSEEPGFYSDYIFKALHEAGRRVTLDPRGLLRRPEFVTSAQRAGVALELSPGSWPGGFEIDPPLDPGHWEFERHKLFYWLWGRFGYDPQIKLPKGEKPDEYGAANRIIHLLIAAHFSDPNMYTWPLANPGLRTAYQDETPDDWAPVASVREAVRARLDRLPSAKLTPLETADLLTAAAASLDKSSIPDFQVLAGLARYHAHKQRAEYHLELSNSANTSASLDLAEEELKAALVDWGSLEKISRVGENDHPGLTDVSLGLEIAAKRRTDNPGGAALAIPPSQQPQPRPQINHEVPKAAVPDQPLTLTLQITPSKDVKVVRLHYRNNNSPAPPRVIEKAGEASLSFTIPASDFPANSDLIYYFEILSTGNSGWFQPDPLAAPPFHIVSAAAPPVN
jgi:hypothetical protein